MTDLVTFVCFVLLMSPPVAYYIVRRRQQLNQERILERRLGNSTVKGTAAQLTWGPPKDEVVRVLARLRALPWLGIYLSETMREASGPMLLAIPLLLVVGTFVSGKWLSVSGALIFGVATSTLPFFYARKKSRQRLKLLGEQLPYLIDLLKSALESGHTMLRALQMAGQNLPEPISSELRVIVEQVQLGMTLPLALEAMYQRAPVEELGFLVAAVRVQTDVGNSLAEVFEHVSEGMRTASGPSTNCARSPRNRGRARSSSPCFRSSCSGPSASSIRTIRARFSITITGKKCSRPRSCLT